MGGAGSGFGGMMGIPSLWGGNMGGSMGMYGASPYGNMGGMGQMPMLGGQFTQPYNPYSMGGGGMQGNFGAGGQNTSGWGDLLSRIGMTPQQQAYREQLAAHFDNGLPAQQQPPPGMGQGGGSNPTGMGTGMIWLNQMHGGPQPQAQYGGGGNLMAMQPPWLQGGRK